MTREEMDAIQADLIRDAMKWRMRSPLLLDALYQITFRFKPVTGLDEVALTIAREAIHKAEER